MPTDISVIHASMKWDRVKRAAFAADLAALQKQCVVITLTEVGGLTDAELRKAAGTWQVYRGPNLPGQDECAILWHPSLTAVAPGSVHALNETQYRQKSGALFPKCYAAVQPLRFPSGHVVTVATLHAALRNTPLRVKVSDEILRNLGAFLLTVEGDVIVAADWNLGYRVAAHRKILEPLAATTGLTWAWQDNVDPADTKRTLIDGVLTSLPVRESTLLPAIASSDHWPVRVDLTLSAVTPLPGTPPPFVPPKPAPPEAPVSKLPDNLPKILRDAGLKVVEHNGWQDRGRPGAFAPVGVLCHHTATTARTSDAATANLLIKGRSDLPGPLSQLGLARDGTVHVIAAGRANHAGKAKASGSVAASDDGNRLYIGIEAFNDGVGEPWPAKQYDAYVLLAATLSKHVTGNSAETVRAHKETSRTGKIDPLFPMTPFRASVAKRIADKPASPEKEAPVLNSVQKARVAIAEAIAEINRAIALLTQVDKKRVAARAQIAALFAARTALTLILKRLPVA